MNCELEHSIKVCEGNHHKRINVYSVTKLLNIMLLMIQRIHITMYMHERFVLDIQAVICHHMQHNI